MCIKFFKRLSLMSKHNSSCYDSFSKYFQAKCSYLKKEINHMGRIKRAATRLVKGLSDPTYEERLKALKKQPLEKRGLIFNFGKVQYSYRGFSKSCGCHFPFNLKSCTDVRIVCAFYLDNR